MITGAQGILIVIIVFMIALAIIVNRFSKQ